ncbi:MAG TPA: serine protease [Cyclobacteriaceae bacterium]|jgi:S1-C subfamily serine protease|nr:serine protease [Cyclobacteriaceae bacterium]
MEELELIEKYFSRELNEKERGAFEKKMHDDDLFRQRAEDHIQFLKSFKQYGDRKLKKEALEKIHDEMDFSTEAKVVPLSRWEKYGRTVAIAASVALLCTVGTFFALKYSNEQHETNFEILRREVNGLKRSQNQILKDIKEKANAKPEFAPSKYSGTGFLVSGNGYIVTAYHVVKSSDSVFVENEKFGRLKVSVVYKNPETDVALLLVMDEQFKNLHAVPFAIRNSEGVLGEPVYTLGYPRNEIVYGDGTISATSGYEQNESSYQISIPVNPGNSGGPMIDQQGAVIGIVNGVQTDARGTAFAVKSNVLLDEIKNVPLDSLAPPLRVNTTGQLAGMSRVNQIKRWKDYVFMVKVYHGK